MSAAAKTTRHLAVRGRVQGVGYRESMRAAARKLGCTGWVRNRADGSVEALVQGAPECVAALLAWAQRGPPAARVATVEEIPISTPPAEFDEFAVLRSG